MKRRLTLTPVERASLHDAARAEALRLLARRLGRELARGYAADEEPVPAVRKAGAA